MIYRYHLTPRRLGRPVARPGENGWAAKIRRIGRRRSPGSRRRSWVPRGLPAGLRRPASASRRTRAFLYVLLPAVALALAGWGLNTIMQSLEHSGFFKLREIRTAGLERLNNADVLGQLGPVPGRSLFDLDLVSLKGALMTEPWVKEVNLRREYPDTLSVQVIERRPVAVIAGRQVEAIVDESGTLIEQWPNGGELPGQWSSLPVIHGIEAASLRDRDPRAMRGLSAALEILRTDPTAAAEGLDLDVGRMNDTRVQRRGFWLRFGAAPFDEKWHRFLSVEGEIERRHGGFREVDLRFPGRVIVR